MAANFAIVQPNETDAPRVLAEVAKQVARPAPTTEEIQAEAGPARGDGPAGDAAREGIHFCKPAGSRREGLKALEVQVSTLTKALEEARARIARLEGGPPRTDPRTLRSRRTGRGGVKPATPSCDA